MTKKTISAVKALEAAQKIAFAPFVFQTTTSLRNLGVLAHIFDQQKVGGVTIAQISKDLDISEYGLSVLLEIAESSDIVTKDEEGIFDLTKTGYFLAFNNMTAINLNFTQEVCYKGLMHLQEAIETQKPSGLKELGPWPTIYEGLSQLTPKVQQSWFEFDHYYSDGVFEEALKVIFEHNPKNVFDVGCNTGKFAIKCCSYNPDVNVTMFDLPGQLKKALKNTKDKGFEARVKGVEVDWLSDKPKMIEGADTFWMSQFLDCFSKDEILKILSTCAAKMSPDAQLLIMETFTDRQAFDNSKFILEATSLYFTVMANGNSKMYKASEFIELVDQAGLKLIEDVAVGQYHTILKCRKK